MRKSSIPSFPNVTKCNPSIKNVMRESIKNVMRESIKNVMRESTNLITEKN